MDIEWYTSSAQPSMITIASYGISFNSEAVEMLGNPPYVKFGFIKENNIIVIKPFLSDENDAIKVVKNSNGDQQRVNKKDLIQTIKQMFNIDLKRALRVPCHWSQKYEALLLDINNSKEV